ncbi:hypothetical protein I5L01_13490 [Erythrobacter sp. YJ-T3-07]|uniref:hypothetical protein n=1 Tax=Erythrobacter sp. YJ-T3-07 TaxID=2793063 RepID=UPI0018D39BB4|nr:hypothetical protein [Erythrobacter sp. YJ-T3-07]MBH1945236.1 hypothetical protein [Erythrobacter sp. YJ-T3-07]
MHIVSLAGLAVATLALVACNSGREAQPDQATSNSENAQQASSDAEQPAGVNDGIPDLTPATLTPEAQKGEKGARNVLLSFTRAIELKEFDQAWDLMVPKLRENLSREQFTQTFAGLGDLTVSAPAGTMEGAAGTSYYEVPITIRGATGQTLTGEIVLSRVNDVPGATEEQLQWRVRRFSVSSS